MTSRCSKIAHTEEKRGWTCYKSMVELSSLRFSFHVSIYCVWRVVEMPAYCTCKKETDFLELKYIFTSEANHFTEGFFIPSVN